ncbi:MAG TPA: 50S ribosomal protein L3 N(5)-glutamine methyltransferase [Burkholderiales bacterium]|nr:50S ribosomal protein L3 N(5)-glutamine methyltransferase [Burkholderiales bacterium]
MPDDAASRIFTVRDMLRYAVKGFNEAGLYYGHGTHNARDEAAYLILHALHLPLGKLQLSLARRLDEKEKQVILMLLQLRIKKRIPAAYLTKEAWLGDCRFYVDQRAIVPRSFIAELLREKLSPWIVHPHKIGAALDLCTGSGCLAILMALAFPDAKIDASDVSSAALQVARRNVGDYQLKSRIQPIKSDLFGTLRGRRYDLILANPPYVNAQSMHALPKEYRHEPRIALAGGRDGLHLVRRILQTASGHLNPNGLLIVEIGHNRRALERAFPKLEFTWLDTSAGDEYVFLLRREQLIEPA